MTMNRRALVAAAACAATVGLWPGVASAAPDLGSAAAAGSVSETPTLPGPAQSTHAAAADYADAHPGSAPPGANDVACVPSAAHPNPVILAHGSDSNAYSDWAALAPRLRVAGYCVFAVNYGGAPDSGDGDAGSGGTGSVGTEHPGNFGTEDMVASAEQVADFVRRVRESSGAPKVDLVGFSQGATVTRHFVNKLGGAAVVDRWVGMASPSYGGVFYGLVPIADAVPGGRAVVSLFTTTAVEQQAQGSDFLTELNAPSDTVPGVRYTTIGTRYDEMIQPYTNIALRGPGADNILIQDRCPQNKTGHMNMPYDPYTLGLVEQALDPTAPAPTCRPVPLGTGMAGMIGR
ncbi:esterase/lipase family protein [Rhodococcus sp. NPDC058505]|uniref:esterase/lipase family protein n=1 Tax=Rhodococcus sp. NPDC058505 TaxID=3346531 RepID=UPI0036529A39